MVLVPNAVEDDVCSLRIGASCVHKLPVRCSKGLANKGESGPAGADAAIALTAPLLWVKPSGGCRDIRVGDYFSEIEMNYKDLLLSLASYPDSTPPAAVDVAVDLPPPIGAKPSALAEIAL
jgi:hypothetical protein